MAELSLDDSRKEEQLAEGLLAILSPAVQQVDGKIGDVRCDLIVVSMPSSNSWFIQGALQICSSIESCASVTLSVTGLIITACHYTMTG